MNEVNNEPDIKYRKQHIPSFQFQTFAYLIVFPNQGLSIATHRHQLEGFIPKTTSRKSNTCKQLAVSIEYFDRLQQGPANKKPFLINPQAQIFSKRLLIIRNLLQVNIKFLECGSNFCVDNLLAKIEILAFTGIDSI